MYRPDSLPEASSSMLERFFLFLILGRVARCARYAFLSSSVSCCSVVVPVETNSCRVPSSKLDRLWYCKQVTNPFKYLKI